MRTVGLLGLSIALLGCGGRAAPPNLIVIAVDTLRADHLGAYGYPRPTSPNLDRLAAGGTVFTRATAPSSWTKPSIASLFTSRLPSEHGAVAFDRHLSPGLPTLAGALSAAGYRTLGVVGNFVHLNEETGIDRGFEVWRTVSNVERGADGAQWEHTDGRPIALSAPSGERLDREVLDHLPEPGTGPLFLYVHYMEPHADYDPPDAQRARFVTDPAAHARRRDASSDYVVDLAAGRQSADAAERQRLIDLYDAEISTVDAAIGALIEALEQRGWLRDAVIAIVSDHGEEFDEHGAWFHGIALYSESLHVPLILYDTRDPRPARRDEPVDLLDVPTTLLRIAGVEPPAGMRGRDLRAEALPEREQIAQLHPDPVFEQQVSRRQRTAVTRWPWKAIASSDGTAVAYRIDRDPGEREPLRPDAPDVPDALRAELERWTARSTRLPDDATAPIDADTREGLRALGYAE